MGTRIHGPLPPTLGEAFALATSEETERYFHAAEGLEGSRLPCWITKTGGLAALVRMGRFTQNIARYQLHFGHAAVLVVSLEEIQADVAAVVHRVAKHVGGNVGPRLEQILSAASAPEGVRWLNACSETRSTATVS